VIDVIQVDLPSFGCDAGRPGIPVAVHEARLQAAAERMGRARLDGLVVYGDREHFANLAYLTGFDPRFEEALLLLNADGGRRLIVGNECMGYLPDAALACDVERFQEFSLPGQPRDQSRPLGQILSDFGIGAGRRIGCVGWKCFSSDRVPGGPEAIDLPSFLVDLLRELTGGPDRVVNATGLFMGLADGLRLTCEPEQIADFEYASAITSQAVLAVLRHLDEGVEEADLEKHLDSAGLPLSCHRMIGFGDKARRGLASPSNRRAHLGDPFTVGFGVTGSLTCRAGCVARGPSDLPAETRDVFPRLAANYFDVVAAWYEHVRVGATGGEVFAAAESRRDASLYDFAVNPGHCMHLDEWVHSPFSPGSSVELRSGMALQMDIIPVSKGPFCYVNAEDGLVLADEPLRQVLRDRFGGLWRRVQARRAFMGDALGIVLDESVLPLSNAPAYLPPYAMRTDHVLARR